MNPRRIRLTALSRRIVDKITQPMPALATDTIIIGKTDRRIFWPIMLVGVFLMGVMIYSFSNGLLVLAATALPGDFTITADSINATNFSLVPGAAQSDNKTPVAVIKMDATIKNQVITRHLGPITVKVSAGNNGTPVTVTGLTVDATSIDAGNAQFTNLVLTTGPNGDTFQQSANTQVLTNATINAPYLVANSITLPGLSVAISIG
ncbi:MAG TPA: DUF6230 family protein [Ktedonosporobacter sp.]|nr:DUF6230 family protein [Ktedonosporobacter sp.]